MATNGISTLGTKQLRQEAKLAIATAKRQGKTVALDGTITGSIDPTAPIIVPTTNTILHSCQHSMTITVLLIIPIQADFYKDVLGIRILSLQLLKKDWY